MAEIEIAFYSPTGVPRTVDPDKILAGVSWELLEAGGMGQASIPLAEAFDATHKVLGGDIVKIWVLPETHPRYIGRVATPSDTLDLAESYSLTAYGEMEEMNRIRIDCKIVRPGGADLADFADYLLRHYSARKGQTYESNFMPTGVLLETLDLEDATVREGFDKLFEQAPGAVVWGWEVNPLTGNKRCYIRPRVATVAWSQYVGEGVRVINRTREYSDIANRLAPLKGGKARFGNLVGLAVQDAGRPNSSFELPTAVAESAGNLFRTVSFEEAAPNQFWDFLPSVGGADFTSVAHIGVRAVELDALNERVYQEQFTSLLAPVPGNLYELFAWARRETGNQGSVVTGLLKWVNAAGTQQGSDVTLTIVPPSVIWERYQVTTICPVGATGYKIEYRLTTDNGDGVYIDDVGLFDRSAVEQSGWQILPRGTATVEEEDPAYEEDAYHGCLSYYVRVTSSDVDENDVALRPRNNARIPVTSGQEIRYGFWLKSPPGATATPKIILRIAPKALDGSDANGVIENETSFAAGAALATWTRYSTTYVLPSESASIEFALIIRGDGELLIDAAFVRDASTDPDEYIEGDTWQRDVAATEVCDVGSPAYLSEATYGRQEDTATNESLVEWNAEAQNFAKVWFEDRAVIGGPQRVDLDDEEAQIIAPGDGTKLRIAGLANTFGDFWPVRVRYSWPGKLAVSIELGDPVTTLAKLLAMSQQRQSASGSVSASGGVSAGISIPVSLTNGGLGASHADIAAVLATLGLDGGETDIIALYGPTTPGSITVQNGIITAHTDAV